MKKKKMKGSIFSTMVKTILLPVIVVLLVIGFTVLAVVNRSLTEAKANEVRNITELTDIKIQNYFTKYEEMARQMASSHDLIRFFTELKAGQAIGDTLGYMANYTTLVNSAANDPDNILVAWMADFDSSQFAESSGYTTEVGEWDVTTRDWYDQVRAEGDVVITEPYENSSTHSMVVSVLAPVRAKKDSEILGVAGVDLTLDNVQTMVKNMNFGDTGVFVLFSQSGMILVGHDEMVQKNISEVFEDNVISMVNGGQTGAIGFRHEDKEWQGYISTVGGTGWTMMAMMERQEYNRDYRIIQTIIVSIFLGAVILLGAGNLLVSKSIVRPIKALAGVAEKIAQGRLDVQADIRAKGETGLVAGSMARTVERLQNYIVYIDEITRVLNQIAAGDLTFRLNQEYSGDFAKIKEALMNISTKLSVTVQDIRESAEKVAAGSGYISDGAQSLSQGTADQAASVEELQATITDISEKIDSNAGNAAEAGRKSVQLRDSVYACNEQMKKMVDAMEEITVASNDIRNVITSIEKIAGQTSMLSLNASIEAARAGNMGRGFAVVASQVGELAGSSMEASKTTANLVVNALEAVEKGRKLTEETDRMLQTVVESIDEVAAAVEEISGASTEQAVAVNQVITGMEQISNVIETNAAMAEESSASAIELARQAQAMNELMGAFKLEEQL